jgi:hypothetical protein
VKKVLAVIAAIVGIVLVLVALLISVLAFLQGQIEKPAVLVPVISVSVPALLTGVLLIRFAGRSLRFMRVVQIGLGVGLAVGIAVVGGLQHMGAFDRNKVSLEDGVLLIQGKLDLELLADFRQVLASNDLRDVRVRLRSPGGTTYVGMAIGREIHRRHLDVEVDKRCISSCANYLFTAGRNKYVKSPSHVQFHGGALQPNFVANAQKLLEQGKQMINREEMPADLDLRRFRELTGLVDDFPFNSASQILAEKAFFDEIGVSPLTPVYGQYGDYSAWLNDGIHDSFSYLPEDYALLGVTNVMVTGPRSDNVLGSQASPFRAKTSTTTIHALQAEIAALYEKLEAATSFGADGIWRNLAP